MDPSELAKRYAAIGATANPHPQQENVRTPAHMATPEPEPPDPRRERVWTFSFEWISPKGQRYSAVFTNKILNIDEQVKAGVIESQLIKGQPYSSLNPNVASVVRAASWLAFSLTDKRNQSPAGWADNFFALDDIELVVQLYLEVLGHEGMFRGVVTSQIQGNAKGKDPTRDAPSVVVEPVQVASEPSTVHWPVDT